MLEEAIQTADRILRAVPPIVHVPLPSPRLQLQDALCTLTTSEGFCWIPDPVSVRLLRNSVFYNEPEYSQLFLSYLHHGQSLLLSDGKDVQVETSLGLPRAAGNTLLFPNVKKEFIFSMPTRQPFYFLAGVQSAQEREEPMPGLENTKVRPIWVNGEKVYRMKSGGATVWLREEQDAYHLLVEYRDPALADQLEVSNKYSAQAVREYRLPANELKRVLTKISG